MPTNPSLHSQQASFSGSLIRTSAPTPDDVRAPSASKKVEKRFGVYRNNVMVSLTEALMASFPTILALVGEDYFRAMTRVFISDHPPRNAMLSRYGDAFGAFLDQFAPVRDLPYLGDVARIDYAWLEAYHAKDQAPLEAAALQGVPPEQLPELLLSLHPACRFLSSPHPAYSIWAAHREDNPQEAMASLPDEAQDCLITRPQWDVMIVKLPPGGFAFVRGLAQGFPLTEAVAAAQQAHPAFDFARNLGGLLETGALTALQPHQT